MQVNGIAVTPQFVDFGAVVSNTYSDRAVKVVNNSSNSVTINPIASLSPPFSILSNDCATLNPGESCNIVVRFSPIGPGQFESSFNTPVIVPDEPSISVRLNGSGLSAPTPVAGGCGHTLVLENDGTLWAWGDNSKGQLGIGTSDPYMTTPQPVGTDHDWSAVAAGCRFSVALKSDGTLWTWGDNAGGELGLGYHGIGTEKNTPQKVGTDNHWVAISAGSNHTLALKSDGTIWTIWAWGWNNFGQIGPGMADPTDQPTQVGTDTDWAAIAAGETNTSFALKSNGTLWAWGENNCGQIGQGNATAYNATPTQIGLNTDWVAVAGGRDHSLAIKSAGTLWAWGCSDFGQLGIVGAPPYIYTPTKVGDDNDWYAVSGGYHHTVAIKSNGSLWTCGDNTYGQLGNGTTPPTSDILIPITTDAYTNPFGNLIAIKAGWGHNIALKSDKTIWTWGRNDTGQLGDGTTSNSNRAEKVFKLKLPTTTAYPAGGTYGSAQVVTLVSDDPEATIYYTTTGLDPVPGQRRNECLQSFSSYQYLSNDHPQVFVPARHFLGSLVMKYQRQRFIRLQISRRPSRHLPPWGLTGPSWLRRPSPTTPALRSRPSGPIASTRPLS